ncbi:DNA-packaging protein [Halovulum sp. GXIMD14793]
MIWTSVKRLFRIRLLLQKVEQTLHQNEGSFGGQVIGSAGSEEVNAFLDALSDNAIRALPYLFEHWAHPGHQLPPDGAWTTWVVLGGRGAGKTRTGAEWVRAQVEGSVPEAPGKCRRVALVGETYDQARDVMVFGDSGILACSPPDRRPDWQATRRKLVWPNGAEAQCFSASDPDAMRGPQFDCAWADELAKWKRGQEAWDMLQFCLRLGDDPRQVVTTTPQNVKVLRDLLEAPGTVLTLAPTRANRVWLAEGFLEKVTARYEGTRLGRQELEGELLTDLEGALWTTEMLEAGRVREVPELDRVIVAVDPPVSSGKASDECGIVVAGVVMQGPPQDWRAYVLEDASIASATPLQWAEQALAAMRRHGAERLVAEVNQGGELVETVMRGIDPLVSYRAVRASRGKAARAEPIAALYEQGRVHHVFGLGALEDQLCQMTVRGFLGQGSPDRADALVWALTDLMTDPAEGFTAPRLRSL